MKKTFYFALLILAVLFYVSCMKVTSNDREGRVEEGAVFEITNIVVSEGLSALVVPRNKKGQKIITAVREAGLGSSEIIIIGDDFYETFM